MFCPYCFLILEGGISYLAGISFLPLGGHIFELRTVRRNNRIILIYAVAFVLDLCCILLSTFV